MKWEELKAARAGIFNHPNAQQTVANAWGAYNANPKTHDGFAEWLTTEKNWSVFVTQFETATGLQLSADYKKSPAAPAVTELKPVPPAGKSSNDHLPWNKPAPTWAPTAVFHKLTESSFADVLARGYDVLSNIIGLPLFATQLGMSEFNVAHYIVFLIGAVAISFIEVWALRALARVQEIRSQPASTDHYTKTVHQFAVFIYTAFFLVGMLLWIVDLYLSILPWVALFNGTAIGWLMGLVLSMLVEFVEVDAHVKTLKALHAAGGSK